ncbi:cation:dicarboxylate symporter family transporter [Aquipseudomonas campi]
MKGSFLTSGVTLMLAAIVCGLLLGYWFPDFALHMKPLSDGFVRLIGMTIGLIIFVLVVSGISHMQSGVKTAKVGGKALLYFETMTLVSLLVGMLFALLLRPGDGLPSALNSIHFGPLPATVERAQHADIDKGQYVDIVHFLLESIPTTFFGAFTQQGNTLQVLLIAVLFGIALVRTGERGAPLREMIDALAQVLFRIIEMILKLAPLAAFGAIAFTVGTYGLGAVLPLLKLVGVIYLASLLFIAVVLGTIARLAGVNLLRLLFYVKEEILLVLFTVSSVAALPGLIVKMEKLGCSPEVVRLVLPTGYTFNLNGSAIYLSMAVLFLAQAEQIELQSMQLLTLLVVAMLTSKGSTAITGSAFVTLAATLSVLHVVPVGAIGLLLGVERLMKCRSLTNMIGNCVACLAIAHWEKAIDRDALRRELGS